jgi:hypothetical protein
LLADCGIAKTAATAPITAAESPITAITVPASHACYENIYLVFVTKDGICSRTPKDDVIIAGTV